MQTHEIMSGPNDDEGFALPPSLALGADEPIRVGEELPEEKESEPETKFTDEERATFATLLTVGQRISTVSVFGHTVKIRSLTVDDDLRVGLSAKAYQESEGFVRAYQAGVVAAGILEIDGVPFRTSLIPETPEECFQKHLEKVRKMYPLVVSQLYGKILELDQEYAEMAQKLGKL